jgi:hypothetical protein
MRVLDLRVKLTEGTNKRLTEAGMVIQKELPASFEAQGLKVEEVTFAIAPVRNSRDDFFQTIEIDDGGEINVSSGEYGQGDKQHCLIQIGKEGFYHTAYLTDKQVEQLVSALIGYLASGKE